MEKIKKVIYNWIDRKFLGGCSSYNSLATRKSCRSKKQARDVFAANSIPHAEGDIFYLPFKAFAFAQKYGFPLCVKPNVSGFSRGSYFPIASFAELVKAVFFVKIWWPSSVIEQYLEGRNYRVVVVAEGIMSVIRRYPPFVIGDGISTISELIDRENTLREKMKLCPVIHKIPKNRAIAKFIARKNLSFTSIPATDEMITLFNRISLAPGGVIETIDKLKVHPDNCELFTRLTPLFSANILGIDAIFEKGIEMSHRDQRVIFLEVNSRPYLKMHDYPRFGEKEDLSTYYKKLNAMEIGEKDVF